MAFSASALAPLMRGMSCFKRPMTDGSRVSEAAAILNSVGVMSSCRVILSSSLAMSVSPVSVEATGTVI